ncbi:YjcQ family protein [Cytobacillus sp. OWB-43]|uniref:YjcQ family protein n=1 Tax=Cytobacillus TaxID=2675230 RepID=UPI002AFFDB08|nr:YjcQ family protein [Cytobacillus sp. OWB-43]MEA1855600.1 YjcQ family protein [Cytobacillus sp. OWB-43]
MDKKKLRIAILKEIDSGNKFLTENNFEVDSETFDEAVRFLYSNGYLKGVSLGDNRIHFFEGTAYLTEKGEEYLSENGTIAKTYKGLKEIRSWLP